jgi:hypothetical protein
MTFKLARSLEYGTAQWQTPMRTGENSGAVLADFASLQARRADTYLLLGATVVGANRLDVWTPHSLGTAVRVGNTVPKSRALATNVTLGCHVALSVARASCLA